jgi:endonuclease/exonuclease/phosphatase family metal-dependent hydrolase
LQFGILSIATWNIGGTEFLGSTTSKDRKKLSAEIAKLCTDHKLDILLLQEIATEDGELVFDVPAGYSCRKEIVINSREHAHPKKWNRYGNTQKTLGQGSAIVWRENLQHGSLWRLASERGPELQCEGVRLDTGLYVGSRDSEPRVAMVARFVKDGRQIVVVNVHLTTLQYEREGTVERDHQGAVVRTRQLRLILDGIVSAYNAWWLRDAPHAQTTDTPKPPIWIIGGDINAIPESEEVSMLRRARFVDLCNRKGQGSKRRKGGNMAELTLDYLFAGVVHHGLVVSDIRTSEPVYMQSSDHLPIFSELEFEL